MFSSSLAASATSADGDRNDLPDRLLIQGDGDMPDGCVDAADELGNGRVGGIFSAGVFALGGEGEKEILSAVQAAALPSRGSTISRVVPG